MKETPAELRLAPAGTYERVFRDGERVLLTVKAGWPVLEDSGPGPRRVNRYYEALFTRWRKRWEGPVLDRARAAAGPDTAPWEAGIDFKATRLESGLLSLFWDVREETGQRRPLRFRRGDTWRLPEGVPVTLRELLPPGRRWKRAVLDEVRRQIGEQLDRGESLYWTEWSRLAALRFSPDRFFLTEGGPAVFYPVESIAPALEGFPTFPLTRLMSASRASGPDDTRPEETSPAE